MKPTLIALALTLTLAPLPLQAVQQAETYEQASSLVGDDGYILFAYADGWDTYSRRVCQTLMNSAKVKKVARNAVLMELPVPEAPTKEEQADLQKRFGKLKLPKADSYPALLLFDKDGRHYSTICGPFMQKARPTKVSALLEARLAGCQKQRKLLEEAQKAEGVEKARLLCQASIIPDIARPDNLGKQLRAADPEDKSGVIRRLLFNPWAFTEKIRKMEPDAALAELEKMLADNAYTDEQKQIFCTNAIGVLHRHGGENAAERIADYARRMRAFAPDTTLGKSYPIVTRQWVSQLSYAEGWAPNNLPKDNTPVELKGPLPISEAGTYSLLFQYESGRQGATILAVELYDGDKKVAEDRHRGFAGIKSDKNNYDLKVTAPVREPRLFITFDMKGKLDSRGHVIIHRQ